MNEYNSAGVSIFKSPGAIDLVLDKPEQLAQMRKLLERGLNTWENSPKWATILWEMLDAAPAELDR